MDTGWADVRNCNWLHEAAFFRSVLEAADIQARIPDEHTLSANPALGAALGGVRLQVRQADIARARQVLEQAAVENGDALRRDRSSHDHS